MKLIVHVASAVACLIASVAVRPADSLRPNASSPERDFTFTYIAKVPAAPQGAKSSRVWIPLPQSNEYQTIDDLKIETRFAYEKRRDSQYGNEFLFVEIPAAELAAPAEVCLSFHGARREHRVVLDSHTASVGPPMGDTTSLQRFLEPDRLVPLQGVISDLSTQVTQGKAEPIEKARAIYNYVVATMRYDKSGTGWGNGDAIWACTSKRGNCTDFHSLFIGMLRAAGIPSRFEIGFSIPSEHAGTIPGYHCWAEFYVEPYGWIPVDASEAWKHPEKKDYFFGSHDANRVQFTMGRDIRLEPQQQGGPLNYFIYPYAEVDGKPFAVESNFSFRDRVGDN
jgi:transglutaminase-like putative cysteine protease